MMTKSRSEPSAHESGASFDSGPHEGWYAHRKVA